MQEYITVKQASEIFGKSKQMLRKLKRDQVVRSRIGEDGFLYIHYNDLINQYGDQKTSNNHITSDVIIPRVKEEDNSGKNKFLELELQRLKSERESDRKEKSRIQNFLENELTKKEEEIVRLQKIVEGKDQRLENMTNQYMDQVANIQRSLTNEQTLNLERSKEIMKMQELLQPPKRKKLLGIF